MKDKLTVQYDSSIDGYRIVWWLADEEDLGGTLGEGIGPKDDEPTEQREWECWAAEWAARDSIGVMHDRAGLHWESEAQAKAALRLANQRLRMGRRTLEDWEKKALAHKWRPPKRR